jgi:tetratricopeptide (TPR) repeat protein
MGTAFNRLGRYDEAVAAFASAVRYGPNQPMAYNNMAYSYGRLGRTDEEIAALRKAIALRPSYAIAHFNLALALLRKGKRAEAVREHAVLAELDDDLAAKLHKELDAAR